MTNRRYVLATNKVWHFDAFMRKRPELPGEWVICSSPQDLLPLISSLSPRYVFFPHWSDIVDKAILEATECVCFHMTDLPYGRGGSPLQNLIVRGHTETMLSALRMTEILDAGPVYAKRPLSLAGTAEEIFKRAAETISELMAWIAETNPAPVDQTGQVTVFGRRKPSQSLIPVSAKADELYNHIRMLDAPTYPQAYIDHGEWRVEFTNAKVVKEGVRAAARFRRRNTDYEG